MKYVSKYLLAISVIASSLCVFSPSFAMDGGHAAADHAPAALPTLDQVSTILTRDFDTRIQEPWHKPARGFEIWHHVSKSQAVEVLGYTAAGTGATVAGLTLGSFLYNLRTGNIGAWARSVGSAIHSFGSGLVSLPCLMATCPVASTALFIKIVREIYRRTARGKCLLLRVQLENELRDLQALFAGNFDFTAADQAEVRARSLYPYSTTPLIDLLERLSQSDALVEKIIKDVTEIERGGLKETDVREACAALKAAATRLSLGLLSNINWIRQAPVFKEQETKQAEYQTRRAENEQRQADRDAILQAGGNLSYNANAMLGSRQPAVIVANAAA